MCIVLKNNTPEIIVKSRIIVSLKIVKSRIIVNLKIVKSRIIVNLKIVKSRIFVNLKVIKSSIDYTARTGNNETVRPKLIDIAEFDIPN